MKKRNRQLLSALIVTLLSATAVFAEEPSGSSVWFDFNGDGFTDSSDWDELSVWVRDYKREDNGKVNFGNQEVPATLNLMINEMTESGPARSNPTELSEAPEFYLIDGYSSPVKNQNPLGTCWAFSTISAVESNSLIKSKGIPNLADVSSLKFNREDNTFDFSELYLTLEHVNRVTNGSQKGEGPESLENTTADAINTGGFISNSAIILSSWGGSVTEEDEPYAPLSSEDGSTNEYGYHNKEKDLADPAVFHLQNLYILNSSAVNHVDLSKKEYVYEGYNEEAVRRMKEAMTEHGALILCYNADASMPGEKGNSAYFNYQNWCQYDDNPFISMNHAVSVVGWNDHYPKENFVTQQGGLPPSDGAWLIKNSWGNYYQMKEMFGDQVDEALESAKGTPDEFAMNYTLNYGIQDEDGHGTGYFWLSYYDHTVLDVSAIDVELQSLGYSYDNLYQYDFYQGPDFNPLALPVKNAGAKTANIFVSEKDETLKAVSVYVPANGSETAIEIYLVNEGETPADSTPVQKITGVYDKGLHTIPLDEAIPLSKGQKYIVTSSLLSGSGDHSFSWLNLETGIREDLQTTQNVNTQKLHMVCNEGESLFSLDSGKTWNNPTALNVQPEGMVFQFGNARIKAYTTNGIEAAAPSVTAEPSASPSPAPLPAAQKTSSSAAALILVLAGVSAFLVWFFLCRD
ncbi:MAG: hypothetical protein IKD66_15835 [Solobacterium sp.]|nr:hypothetical protein [Solobacterium sp.]